jgi:hypothetical protein
MVFPFFIAEIICFFCSIMSQCHIMMSVIPLELQYELRRMRSELAQYGVKMFLSVFQYQCKSFATTTTTAASTATLWGTQ